MFRSHSYSHVDGDQRECSFFDLVKHVGYPGPARTLGGLGWRDK
jgi:hypothetical protein